jgi:hypothetical protein
LNILDVKNTGGKAIFHTKHKVLHVVPLWISKEMNFWFVLLIVKHPALNILHTHMYITPGNPLTHIMLLCSLNVEKNFLSWLRRSNYAAWKGWWAQICVWISATKTYASRRICQFHIGRIYLSHRIII